MTLVKQIDSRDGMKYELPKQSKKERTQTHHATSTWLKRARHIMARLRLPA